MDGFICRYDGNHVGRSKIGAVGMTAFPVPGEPAHAGGDTDGSHCPTQDTTSPGYHQAVSYRPQSDLHQLHQGRRRGDGCVITPAATQPVAPSTSGNRLTVPAIHYRIVQKPIETNGWCRQLPSASRRSRGPIDPNAWEPSVGIGPLAYN